MILLISCKSNNFTPERDYNFRYQSQSLSDKKIFEEIYFDSNTQVYELKEKADVLEKNFSITTVKMKLDERSKKEIHDLYVSLKPINLYNCFYDTQNGELLEKLFISFYADDNKIDSSKCYEFKKNQKIQRLNTLIRNKLKSTDTYKKTFKWEFIAK